MNFEVVFPPFFILFFFFSFWTNWPQMLLQHHASPCSKRGFWWTPQNQMEANEAGVAVVIALLVEILAGHTVPGPGINIP